jgi:hypothetical protein
MSITRGDEAANYRRAESIDPQGEIDLYTVGAA